MNNWDKLSKENKVSISLHDLYTNVNISLCEIITKVRPLIGKFSNRNCVRIKILLCVLRYLHRSLSSGCHAQRLNFHWLHEQMLWKTLSIVSIIPVFFKTWIWKLKKFSFAQNSFSSTLEKIEIADGTDFTPEKSTFTAVPAVSIEQFRDKKRAETIISEHSQNFSMSLAWSSLFFRIFIRLKKQLENDSFFPLTKP